MRIPSIIAYSTTNTERYANVFRRAVGHGNAYQTNKHNSDKVKRALKVPEVDIVSNGHINASTSNKVQPHISQSLVFIEQILLAEEEVMVYCCWRGQAQ